MDEQPRPNPPLRGARARRRRAAANARRFRKSRVVVAGVSTAVMGALAATMAVSASGGAATSGTTSGTSVSNSSDSSSSSGSDESWDVPSWDDDDAGAVPYDRSPSAPSGTSTPSAHTSSGGS